MKKFLLLAALACGSLNAMAQTISANGNCIGTETGDYIYVTISNPNGYAAMQFDVTLPSGYELFTTTDNNGKVTIPTSKGNALKDVERAYQEKTGDEDFVFSVSKSITNGKLRVVIYNMENEPLGEGTLLSFRIKGDGKSAGDITIDGIILAGDKSSAQNGTGLNLKAVIAKGIPMSVTSDKGVTTFVSPFDVNLPNGWKASEGEYNASSKIVTIDDEKAPAKLTAGVPSFVFGEKGDAVCFGVEDKNCLGNGKVLTGTFDGLTATNGYVLQGGKLREITTPGITIPAYKAYIAGDKSVKGISFGDVDAISSVEVGNGEQVIYNVSGQRLNKTQKGVNIVNGKKYIVK